MTSIKLLLDIVPEKKPEPEKKSDVPIKESIEDQVHNMLELIDSSHDSHVEWLTINRLYESLKKCKQTPRVDNLIKLIEPRLAKYGYHKVASTKGTA